MIASDITGARRHKSWHAIWLLVLFAAIVVGCSSQSEETTSVQGKISFEGKPVSGGLINFQSGGGRPIGGPIDADGTYSYELPPGEYQVRIDTPPQLPADWKEGDPAPQLGPREVPEQYANFNSSGLTATVTEDGEQTFDFNLP